LIWLRLSGGVEMSTAITTSAQTLRAKPIGRLSAMPPSTSSRPSISTGANAPGTDMLARMAWDRLPRLSTTASPVSMSAATARNGIGSFWKSVVPTVGSTSLRRKLSIETPATTPLGSARPSPVRPYSGANSVL
jgi:hypothetical protein